MVTTSRGQAGSVPSPPMPPPRNPFPRNAWLAAALLTLATPAADAASWLACNHKTLTPAVAVERRAPDYPEAARVSGAEGFVDVAFTVLTDGSVGWARLLRAEPTGYFEAAALTTVRDWRFEPARSVQGPVECRLQSRLRFRLSDSISPGGEPGQPRPDEPLSGVEPRYPEAARLEEQEGYVELEYEVGEDGRVRRPAVLLAAPAGVFEGAVLDALREFRYAPAAAPRRVTRRFDFDLPQYTGRRPAAAAFLATASYPADACRKAIAGSVRMTLQVDAQGRVLDARVEGAEPAGVFETTALAIARKSRLAPAYRRGLASPAAMSMTMRFDPARGCQSGAPGRPAPPARRGSSSRPS